MDVVSRGAQVVVDHAADFGGDAEEAWGGGNGDGRVVGIIDLSSMRVMGSGARS